MGIGIDITLVSRMEKNVDNPAFMKKVFTGAERAYIGEKGNRAQTAAGLFCAKEALLKAFGMGLGGISFQEIEVTHDESGAPRIQCPTDKILHLSISHMGDIAVAQVIVESEGDAC